MEVLARIRRRLARVAAEGSPARFVSRRLDILGQIMDDPPSGRLTMVVP